MQHHLILVREIDQQMSGSGCCGRVEGDLTGWVGSGEKCFFPERRALMDSIGAIYRAVRREFGEQVEITVVDPRNQLAFLPLVLRDAMRFRVPLLTALQAAFSASVATGILDGQVLFRGEVPSADEALACIAGRLDIHAVGAPPQADG